MKDDVIIGISISKILFLNVIFPEAIYYHRNFILKKSKLVLNSLILVQHPNTEFSRVQSRTHPPLATHVTSDNVSVANGTCLEIFFLNLLPLL
jgi:hypothetical protein